MLFTYISNAYFWRRKVIVNALWNLLGLPLLLLVPVNWMDRVTLIAIDYTD